LECRQLLAVQPFPVPLSPVTTDGPLVFETAAQAEIDADGEVETFTVDLDAGQRIALVVDADAALQASVELLDGQLAVVGDASAPAAGDNVLVQGVATTAGSYSISVSGQNGSTGAFSVRLVLNAVLEIEPDGGATNDAAASAESLEPSFIGLGGARGAGGVVGSLDSGSGAVDDWYKFKLADGATASIAVRPLGSGSLDLEVYDSDGVTRLAVGSSGQRGQQFVESIVDGTSDSAPNDYYVRLFGSGAEYLLQATKNALMEREPNNSISAGQDVSQVSAAVGSVAGSQSDYYRFDVLAGQTITGAATTPGSGPLEPVNDLDVGIQVFDPSGAPLSHTNVAGNELFFLNGVSAAGQYAVRVFAEHSGGDYALQVDVGSADVPFAVVSSEPSAAALLTASPVQFIVHFNDDLGPSGWEPADLVVDGSLAATGVTLVDSRTLAFDLPSLGEGVHSIALADGAFADADGQPLTPFTSSFEIDATAPRIISSSLAAGAVLSPGPLLYTAVFDSPLDATALDAADIALTGVSSGAHAPTSLSYDEATRTLTVQFAALGEDDYTMSLVSAAEALQDVAGNPLDGEYPAVAGQPSGDGVAGGNFVANFSIDRQTPAEVTLDRLAPLGSFIYGNRDVRGFTHAAGDIDEFQVYAQAGQTLTAIVRPDNPSAIMSISTPGMPAPAVAAGPGLPVLLPLSQAGASGLTTLRIKGDKATTYHAEIVLNAIFEETLGDSSISNALDLGSSSIAVGSGRLAAVGSSDPTAFLIGGLTQESNDTIGTAVFTGVGFGNHTYSTLGVIGDNSQLLAAGLDVDLIEVQLDAGDNLLIDVDAQAIGSPLDAALTLFDAAGRLIVQSDDNGASSDPLINFTASTPGLYYVGVSSFANLSYDPRRPASGVAGGLGAYQLSVVLNGGSEPDDVTPPVVADVDEFTVDGNELQDVLIDVMLSGLDGVDLSNERLEIIAADGVTVLATASANPLGVNATNYDLAIHNFVATADGSYRLRFTSREAADYSLVVAQGVTFEAEPNDNRNVPLRQLTPGRPTLGFLDRNSQSTALATLGAGADGGSLPSNGPAAALVGAGENTAVFNEVEPNNTLPQATPLPLGFDPSESESISAQGTLAFSTDIDYYRVSLQAGDVIGASVFGTATRLTLRDASDTELIRSSQDFSTFYPAASPLPRGGAANLARVINTAGDYYIGVSGAVGDYNLNLQIARPALEREAIGVRQQLFLDFNGASLGPGLITLSPLASFLPAWGLTAAAENAVIDAIVAAVQENFADVAARGLNGDYAATSAPGDFDIEILNSRDNPDAYGSPNVSRVIIGGSVAEFGFDTIGLADSIDVGNFETEESAVLLLDRLSGPSSRADSLNHYQLDPSVSIIDLIGVAVGNIASHEASHLFGNFHTNRLNNVQQVMDQGGTIISYLGLVGNVWGDGDEVDSDFGIDEFAPNEGFVGFQDALNTIAFGLATGTNDPALRGPTIVAFDPPAGLSANPNVSTITVTFNEALDLAAATDPANYTLIAAGPNRVLDGGGNDDIVIPLTPQYDGGLSVQLAVGGGLAPLAEGTYQLTVSAAVTDVDGNRLNGWAGQPAGADVIHHFDLVLIGPSGDLFQIQASVGDRIELHTETPWDDPAASPANTLRPRLSVFDPSGTPIADDIGSVDGKNSAVSFVAQSAGLYTVQIVALAGVGEYLLHSVNTPNPSQFLPGDFNNNGDVDGGDYLAWQRGFNKLSGALRSEGDADGDGDVDVEDLGIWREFYGASATPSTHVQVARAVAAADGAEPMFKNSPLPTAEPTARTWSLGSVDPAALGRRALFDSMGFDEREFIARPVDLAQGGEHRLVSRGRQSIRADEALEAAFDELEVGRAARAASPLSALPDNSLN
jgi:hypothetical protein